ncbi:meiotic recombination protein SPO11 isoform X3 [Acanthopagrus latus]|uniref:meiotic recombination protein SPO11 isoform X3 n=1 Tax=Acanthopagrus latus TaxID=8177 RepID=UPI00187CAF50|nr:meiotic recombination protein SPO11 isoform X3 [Acanthopagrus latus]
MMACRGTDLFSEIDMLRAELLHNVEVTADCQRVEEEISQQDVLTRIENIILGIVTSLSKDEAPVLALPNRSSWANVSFDSAIGLQMSSGSSVTTIRSDCALSVAKFAQILKILLVIYRLIQSNSYATKRDIYYNNTQLFGSQKTVDGIVDDISCMLKVPRRSLHVEDGTRIDCNSSSAVSSINSRNKLAPLTAVAVSSNIDGIRNIVSCAKFVLIVEKDATFQRLLDDDFCTKLSPCIIITGKGVPDVNSRLMVRKLWDTLHIPIFALVDADPHGIEIMCIYKYGSVAMSFEAHSLTVPSVMWLGLLPSDLQRLRVPEDALIPLTRTDENKLTSLLKRPYLTSQPDWQKEMELMQQTKVKAEIQSLAAIGPDYLTNIYLPNKLRYGGWV